MATRLLRVVFKIAFSVFFLLFINNPLAPLSVPVIHDGIVTFYPIFLEEYVLNYQIIFSLFVLAGLMLGIVEFIIYSWRRYTEIVEDLIGIAQLWYLREIPEQALALKENIIDMLYPAAYWFFNFSMMLVAIGVIVKFFRLFGNNTREINQK